MEPFMLLYHGTSACLVDLIMKDGIFPRVDSKSKSNWEDAPSNEDLVYLTDCYPIYFGEISRQNRKSNSLVVFEIDTSKLNHLNLLPDEDVLEQAGRGLDDLSSHLTMEERTFYYRDNILNWQNGEYWKASLEAMGTCSHFGVIPPHAITKYSIIGHKENKIFIFNCMDAQISLMNYRFLSSYYKEVIKMIFDENYMPKKNGVLKTHFPAPHNVKVFYNSI
jgi:hypothetical protein